MARCVYYLNSLHERLRRCGRTGRIEFAVSRLVSPRLIEHYAMLPSLLGEGPQLCGTRPTRTIDLWLSLACADFGALHTILTRGAGTSCCLVMVFKMHAFGIIATKGKAKGCAEYSRYLCCVSCLHFNRQKAVYRSRFSCDYGGVIFDALERLGRDAKMRWLRSG